ncbi:MAG: sucrose synthase [Gemmatimonadota bacterium]|nr:sucrose synthase [Gemmatimonadota bacterium]
MIEDLSDLLVRHREPIYYFLQRVRALGERFLSGVDLHHAYSDFRETAVGAQLDDPNLDRLIACTQEAVVRDSMLYLSVRERVAQWRYLQVNSEEMRCAEISVSEYLDVKERLVTGERGEDRFVLEIDLEPFERKFPRLSRPRSIGRGVEHLNRYLSGRLFEERRTKTSRPAPGMRPPEREGLARLVDFLRVHSLGDQPLMLNGTIESTEDLRTALRNAVDLLGKETGDAERARWGKELRRLGFEPGWGRTAERARETMELLLDILEAPDPRHLQDFLARVPMITSIAIVSPHGYFGQANVLGKPDTGGQVVYILDQVRALEDAMRASLYEQGLDVEPEIVVLSRLIPDAGDTTCDLRMERILGTENARILRVPFRTQEGDVVRPWVSRFRIWPYLERFAVDAERELLAELGGRPDMIIGNYSDGNLVATVLSHRLDVTQCNIAHALEKTKYENSDLFWTEHEDEHHFACQFTADVISMNTADFIITSTYQEIAGTNESVGQYESYQSFTMPGLYRVVSGIDCFDPKFNIVSPGANPEVFYPYWEGNRDESPLTEVIRTEIFGSPTGPSRGTFEDPDRPLLFAMSRLDEVKNMTGLLEAFGRSEALRERANLLLVGGTLDEERSSDAGERRQIARMHALMDELGLDGCVRWLEMETDKNRVGEFYRVVADTRGAFVQPAMFEGFGLTVVEAMSSGLPVFATCFGGPSEIVEDGESGYHLDPTLWEQSTARMAEVLATFADDPDEWDRISVNGIERVRERYNWPLYASRLLELSRIYGFWKYISSLERDEPRRYLEMFYGLMYRPLAKRIEQEA